jgi:prolyl oligopeptidase
MNARLAFVLASIIAVCVTAQTKPPETPVREVTDTYFGQTIVDPYRWMEKSDSEMTSWLRAQDAYARSMLHAIAGRDKLLARLNELDNAAPSVTFLKGSGDELYFYFKTEPGADLRKLYVRRRLTGKERLLVDPETLSSHERHVSIDYFEPSLDGTYVAYGVSAGGSEGSVLRIMETATGRILSDQIDRTRFAHVSWLPDNKSFFYWRSNKIPEGMPPSETNKRTRTYLHILGDDPDMDQPIFGYKVSPAIELTEIHYPAVAYSPGSPYVIAYVQRGVKFELSLFAAPVTSLRKDPIPWTKIAGEEDDVTGFAVRANDIYLLTHHDAPRFKIVRTSLIKPDLAHAKVVMPPSDSVISEIDVAKDGLYVSLFDGGIGRVKRVSYANDSAEEVALPFQGTVAFLAADPRYLGALINLTSWTHSPLWYRYTPENKQLRDTRLQPLSPVDFSDYESLEVKAKSNDGTLVPLSIVLRKGLKRDGTHPTILWGYGAYGISTLPSFDPKRLAWLERGGILGYAHVRGGGEYGEDWHRAGQKKTKMNSIDDFIACAEYLIAQGFTSPSKIAAMGRSAGGILVGRAMTKRPDLFAAIVSGVGASNPLRLEMMQGGPQNAVEFGELNIREEFEALRMMDPYVNVTPETKYPAVLLTAGFNDPRIPPWMPGKMTARLQAASSSGKPVLLRVDFHAGHGMGSGRLQLREELADVYAFLLWQFGVAAHFSAPSAR